MKIRDCLDMFYSKEKYASELYDKIRTNSEDEIAEVADVFKKEELVHAQTIQSIHLDTDDTEVPSDLYALLEHKTISEDQLSLKSLKDLFLFALQLEKDSIIEYSEFKKIFDEQSVPYKIFEHLVKMKRIICILY